MSVRLNPETGEPLPIDQQEFYAPPPAHPHPQQFSGPSQVPEPVLQFFDKSVKYVGIPDAQPVLDWINEVAYRIVEMLPRNPERTIALRKLLESKEAVVRTALAK